MKLLPLSALPLLLSATAAQAGTLYKCAAPSGAVTIQSERCPPGSTQVWKREATPEAPLTPEQVAQAEAKRRRDAEDALALARMAGTYREDKPATTAPAAPPPAPEPAKPAVEPEAALPKGPCRRAHELADGIRANPWLEMSDQQMRRLDAWVEEQCRNVGADR